MSASEVRTAPLLGRIRRKLEAEGQGRTLHKRRNADAFELRAAGELLDTFADLEAFARIVGALADDERRASRRAYRVGNPDSGKLLGTFEGETEAEAIAAAVKAYELDRHGPRWLESFELLASEVAHPGERRFAVVCDGRTVPEELAAADAFEDAVRLAHRHADRSGVRIADRWLGEGAAGVVVWWAEGSR